jgi:drug/metabolite transporter (DMT)-like permease
MYQFRIGRIGLTVNSQANWLSALALGTALIGIATASVLIAIASKEIEANAITCNRLLIAGFAFAIWNGSSRLRQDGLSFVEQPSYSKRAIALLSLAGISFAISLSLWAWSITQTSIANSTLLNNMMPIFTTLGSWLIFRQQFSTRFLLGMAVAVIGAMAIGFEDLQAADGNIIGDGAALLAAAFSAVSILTIERLRREFTAPVVMQWTSLAGGWFLLPLVWLTGDRLLPISSVGWTVVIGLGLISQALGQGLLTYSLARFDAGFVAVSMLAIPIVAAVLAMIIFAEQLSLFNYLGFVIVLCGIYLAISNPGDRS